MKAHVNVTTYISERPIALAANFIIEGEDFYEQGVIQVLRKEVHEMKKFRRQVMRLLNNQKLLQERIEEGIRDYIRNTPVKTDEEILKELKVEAEKKGFMFEMDI